MTDGTELGTALLRDNSLPGKITSDRLISSLKKIGEVATNTFFVAMAASSGKRRLAESTCDLWAFSSSLPLTSGVVLRAGVCDYSVVVAPDDASQKMALLTELSGNGHRYLSDGTMSGTVKVAPKSTGGDGTDTVPTRSVKQGGGDSSAKVLGLDAGIFAGSVVAGIILMVGVSVAMIYVLKRFAGIDILSWFRRCVKKAEHESKLVKLQPLYRTTRTYKLESFEASDTSSVMSDQSKATTDSKDRYDTPIGRRGSAKRASVVGLSTVTRQLGREVADDDAMTLSSEVSSVLDDDDDGDAIEYKSRYTKPAAKIRRQSQIDADTDSSSEESTDLELSRRKLAMPSLSRSVVETNNMSTPKGKQRGMMNLPDSRDITAAAKKPAKATEMPSLPGALPLIGVTLATTMSQPREGAATTGSPSVSDQEQLLQSFRVHVSQKRKELDRRSDARSDKPAGGWYAS